ncbi:MAG: hypothetical protein ABSB90_03115 [Thermoplasmata archaeon]
MGWLVAYHALFLAGFAVFLLGVIRAETVWSALGLGLMIGGFVTQQLVLRQSARWAIEGTPFFLGPEPPSRTSNPTGRWLCPACGWRGVRGTASCPRCGRFLVRLLPEPLASPTP